MTGRSRGATAVAKRFARAMWTLLVASFGPRRHHDVANWTPAMWGVTAGFVIATVALLPFDAAAIAYVRDSSAALFGFKRSITDIGRSEWYLVPAFMVLIGLALLDWDRYGANARARLAVVFAQAGFAFASVAVSGILVNIIKFFVGRARPRSMEEFGAFHFEPFSTTYAFISFPSGHATTCGAVAMVLIIWFPRWWPALALLGFAVAISRVSALAHYPSDVVAGFGLGLLYTLHLARWLAVRGKAFRIVPGRILPALSHVRSWRRQPKA